MLLWVDVGVHFCTDPEGVEVGDVEDLEFIQERSAVGSGWLILDESNDFLLHFDEGLNVLFTRVVCPPDGYVEDEVWVDVHIVELLHGFGAEEFVGVFEAVHCGLEFFYDIADGLCVFSVALDRHSEKLALLCMLDGRISNADLNCCVLGVEGGVDCLSWVGDQVVDVEVVDEAG